MHVHVSLVLLQENDAPHQMTRPCSATLMSIAVSSIRHIRSQLQSEFINRDTRIRVINKISSALHSWERANHEKVISRQSQKLTTVFTKSRTKRERTDSFSLFSLSFSLSFFSPQICILSLLFLSLSLFSLLSRYPLQILIQFHIVKLQRSLLWSGAGRTRNIDIARSSTIDFIRNVLRANK